MRHRECRIQVGGGLVVLHCGFPVSGVFSAECHQVMGTGVQFVDLENAQANLLRFRQVAAIGKNYREEQLRIRVCL
jgi:hypothetical protein